MNDKSTIIKTAIAVGHKFEVRAASPGPKEPLGCQETAAAAPDGYQVLPKAF